MRKLMTAMLTVFAISTFTAAHADPGNLVVNPNFAGSAGENCYCAITGWAFSTAGAVAATLAQADLVTNGNFETGSLSGWTASGDVVAVPMPFDGFSNASSGNYMAGFNAGDTAPNGVLSQSISTTVGANYQLAFYYGDCAAITATTCRVGGASQSITASALTGTGQVLATNFITATSSPTLQAFTLAFTATSANTTIAFADYAGNNTYSQDSALDNVSVTGIPEPASLGVLGLGIAGVVAARRRRLERHPGWSLGH